MFFSYLNNAMLNKEFSNLIISDTFIKNNIIK